ncbi:4-hydroxy-2-oxoheptanedioate aldolase [Ignatzschineria rhizosphaerae]|uniref:4-hydroxy-2-oxoheptanedioate aldolase n=1 Tax=Ignatzschineria rhizosphaerae TaxID=2923279 RepID=A0ABY3X6T8_9GAMM|nr:4-hydroxy-2-oxoheptanedioate aldolase [Ignatzschineria rhizosphaerae]
MKLPKNRFKEALQKGDTQIGLWAGLASPYSTEILASIGYDWLLLDGEHAPNDLSSLLSQLQAIAPYQAQGISHPIIRPPVGRPEIIKQLLDLGAQTLLIPMVETKEHAKELVQSMWYPPKGIRGVGSALARASKWNQIEEYLHHADNEMCLLLQVENLTGLKNLEEIVALDGVDGIFIGPADLSASMGHRGNPTHPEVQEAIINTLKTIKSHGKAAGILYANEEGAKKFIEMGFDFVAIGVDTSLLVNASKTLLAQFKTIDNTRDKNSVY